MKYIFVNLAAKRVYTPVTPVANWNYIRVAGKTKVGGVSANAGVQVIHIWRSGLAKG
jgi:hypothetical protein